MGKMNDLVYKSEGGKPITTSLLVAEKFSKEHKNVIQSIQNLVAENSAAKYFHETTYESRGKLYPMYLMTRDGFSLLVMGFTGSEALKFKIDFIEAFNDMENKLKQFNLPKTYSEALQLAANQAKELEIARPKAEVFDHIVDAKNDMSFNDAAKVIGIGRNTMMAFLRRGKYLRLNNTPYQRFIDEGYFVVKLNNKDGIKHNFTQTFVTGKGLTFMSKLFNRHLTNIQNSLTNDLQ